MLNYKQLSYTTEWRLWSDLQATAKSLGVEPTGVLADGSPRYTVPFIIDRTGDGYAVIVSDSVKIIEYLEKTYPDPERPIIGPSPAVQHLARMPIDRFFNSFVVQLVLPAVYDLVLEEDKIAFFNRVSSYFKDLPQDRPEKGFQGVAIMEGSVEFIKLIEEGEENLRGIAASLGSQQLFGGDRPVFVDFVLLAYLNCIRRTRPDVWKYFAKVDEGRFQKAVDSGEEFGKLL